MRGEFRKKNGKKRSFLVLLGTRTVGPKSTSSLGEKREENKGEEKKE